MDVSGTKQREIKLVTMRACILFLLKKGVAREDFLANHKGNQ